MLSILVPTYHYNVFPLASEISRQATDAGIEHEIICLDDGSGGFSEENNRINALADASFSVLETNIGRSAIRNTLARKASFENLLFLDADVMPVHPDFIQNYRPFLDGKDKIVYGGIRYQTEKPPKTQLLRWIYGKEREALDAGTRKKNPYLTFLTLNFLTTKSVMENVPFNENIPNLRHEDTLFSYDLCQAGVPVIHIENPVLHLGLEDSSRFLQKSREAVTALDFLTSEGLLPDSYAALSRFRGRISPFSGIAAFVFRTGRRAMEANLLGSRPSMRIFDLYRLTFLCHQKKR